MKILTVVLCKFTMKTAPQEQRTGTLHCKGDGDIQKDAPQFIVDMQGKRVEMAGVQSFVIIKENGKIILPVYSDQSDRHRMKLALTVLPS